MATVSYMNIFKRGKDSARNAVFEDCSVKERVNCLRATHAAGHYFINK